MAWSKAKVALLCAGGLLFVGTAGVAVHHFSTSSAQRVIIPRGTAPVISTVAAPGGYALDGQVLLPDGHPAAGAQVVAATDRIMFLFTPPSMTQQQRFGTLTDAAGQFQLHSPAKMKGVIVSCPQGYARATAKSLTENPLLKLVPWGRVEGTVSFDGVPAQGAQIMLACVGDEPAAQLNVLCDAAGHYEIPQAPSGKLFMSCTTAGHRWINGEAILLPGESYSINFAANGGHTVVAHLTPLPQSASINSMLTVDPPTSSSTGDFRPLTYQTEPRSGRRGDRPEIRFDHIPPGNYRVSFNLMGNKRIDVAEGKVTVPDAASSDVAEIDAGTFTLKSTDEVRLEQKASTKPTN